MGILRQRFNQGRNTVVFIQQIGEDNESLSKPRAANENLLLRLVLFAPFFDHLTLPIFVIRDILRCSARLVFLALCKTRGLGIPLNTNTWRRPADSITGSRLVAKCV